MPLPLNAPLSQLQKATRTHQASSQADAQNAKLRGVAQQFESVLMGQLLAGVFKSSKTLGGDGGQSDLYRQMFQGPLAEHLVSGGGLGLANMIARGLRARAAPPPVRPAHLPAPLDAPLPAARGGATHTLTLDPSQPALPATGALLDVQHAAADMLADGGAARWAKDGKLTQQDLGSGLATDAAAGGAARFSVRDAN